MRSRYASALLLLLLALPASGRPNDFPTGGNGNATKILGTSVPALSTIGGVLTVGAGPTLSWATPTGVTLSNSTPAAVSASAGAVGVGTTAARSDHVHQLPTIPESLGGLGADVSAIGTGLMCRSAANTPAARTLTAPAAGLTISNASGAAGNPTFALADDLSALEGMSTTGVAVRTATSTWTTRTLTGTSGVNITNGTGVSGNPTFSVDNTFVATLVGTQTLTNKTITSPSISSPTFSGTTAGTVTIGGTPTLGVNLDAGGFKVINLASPTAGSTNAATAAYAEAQKTGGSVDFSLNLSTSWNLATYLGKAGDTPMTSATSSVPWRVPCNGTIKNLTVYGKNDTTSGPLPTVVRCNDATQTVPVYIATTVKCTVSTGGAHVCEDTTHSQAVNKGDLILILNDGNTWSSPGGITASFQFIPTSP